MTPNELNQMIATDKANFDKVAEAMQDLIEELANKKKARFYLEVTGLL